MKRSEFPHQVARAAERRALFPLGEMSITRSALERLEALRLEAVHLIARHHTGDGADCALTLAYRPVGAARSIFRD
jgi:hypothetical protein